MLNIGTSDLSILRLIIKDHEVLYARYVMKVIKKAVREDKNSVPVFEETGGALKGMLMRTTYRQAIIECIDVFIRHEDYERASEATQVKDMVDVYLLLSEPVATPNS